MSWLQIVALAAATYLLLASCVITWLLVLAHRAPMVDARYHWISK